MTAREWLDAAQARADAATKGPWEYAAETEEIVSPDGGIVEMTWPGRNRANATFIAHARTDAPALVAALRAVLDVHQACDSTPERTPVCVTCQGRAGVWECGCWADEDRQPICHACAVDWPCPTVRAITAALDPTAVREQIGDLT